MSILTVKKYIKSPVLVISTICFLMYFGFSIYKIEVTMATDAIVCALKMTQITFLYFLFVSYEFFSQSKRSHCDETIGSIGMGRIKEDGYQFFFLLLQGFLLCVYLYRYVCSGGDNSRAFAVFSFKLIGIHYFLLIVFAILLGMCFSKLCSQVTAYCTMIGFYMLFSAKVIEGMQQMAVGNGKAYRWIDLINLYSKEYDAMTDSYYLYSVENVNIQRIGIWIFLCLVLLCFFSFKRKKLFTLIPFTGLVVCMVYFFMPTSAVHLDIGFNGQDAWTENLVYYEWMIDCEDESRYQDADFQVTSYEAKFKVNRQLSGKVTVGLKESGREKYDFTLFHGYKVEKIENQEGESVPFEQKEDYVTVKGTGCEALTFYYEGCTKRYYSTSQGIFLPGYWAYYPMPGKRKMYRKQLGYWGDELESLGYEVPFEVTVDTKQKAVCNLEEIGKNHFKGVSDGITIFASDFIVEQRIGNCRIIMPSLGGEQQIYKEEIERYEAFIKKYNTNQQEAKTIFVPPSINGQFYYFGKDHVIGELTVLEFEYDHFLETGELYDLISEDELPVLEEEVQ